MTTLGRPMDSPGSLIATHSGLRGRPGAELSAELVEETVGRFAHLLGDRALPAEIAVARDERPTARSSPRP